MTAVKSTDPALRLLDAGLEGKLGRLFHGVATGAAGVTTRPLLEGAGAAACERAYMEKGCVV